MVGAVVGDMAGAVVGAMAGAVVGAMAGAVVGATAGPVSGATAGPVSGATAGTVSGGTICAHAHVAVTSIAPAIKAEVIRANMFDSLWWENSCVATPRHSMERLTRCMWGDELSGHCDSLFVGPGFIIYIYQ
jgi:hypothetical protein